MNLDSVLLKFHNVKRCDDGRYYTALCPGHDDQQSSLTITPKNDKILLHCHANCAFDKILTKAGLGPDDLRNGHHTNGHKPAIVATYDYRSADSRLLYQAVRYDTIPKTFKQRQPAGKGGYIWSLTKPPVERVLYRLPELIIADESQPVFVVEGEKDADRLISLGLVATTNVGGAGKWKPEYNQWLTGRDVIILPDNDDAGRDHAQKVKSSLTGYAASVKIVELPGLPQKGDVSDWLNQGHTKEELLELVQQGPKDSTWADLEQIIGPVEWDWRGWLPKGFMTLVVANSGDGKSSLELDIAKRYLTGDPWPDGSPFTGETGKILWVETEAAQVLNLDRAKKWRLPLDRFVSPLDNPLDNVSLDNPEHQAAIYAKARKPDVKLIVVDSFSGGTRKNSRASNEMGAVGAFLAELARDTGKPVLVSHHLRKKGILDGNDITLDRLRDSSAIPQYARVVWAIDEPDAELKEKKRLYVIKNNLTRFPEPIGFQIRDNGLDFGEAPKPPRKETQADKAADLLRVLLASEPKSQDFIKTEAEGAGISMATINRAKANLNIVSKKVGTVWYWSLPAKDYK